MKDITFLIQDLLAPASASLTQETPKEIADVIARHPVEPVNNASSLQFLLQTLTVSPSLWMGSHERLPSGSWPQLHEPRALDVFMFMLKGTEDRIRNIVQEYGTKRDARRVLAEFCKACVQGSENGNPLIQVVLMSALLYGLQKHRRERYEYIRDRSKRLTRKVPHVGGISSRHLIPGGMWDNSEQFINVAIPIILHYVQDHALSAFSTCIEHGLFVKDETFPAWLAAQVVYSVSEERLSRWMTSSKMLTILVTALSHTYKDGHLFDGIASQVSILSGTIQWVKGAPLQRSLEDTRQSLVFKASGSFAKSISRLIAALKKSSSFESLNNLTTICNAVCRDVALSWLISPLRHVGYHELSKSLNESQLPRLEPVSFDLPWTLAKTFTFSFIFILESLEQALAISPEHLSILSQDAKYTRSTSVLAALNALANLSFTATDESLGVQLTWQQSMGHLVGTLLLLTNADPDTLSHVSIDSLDESRDRSKGSSSKPKTFSLGALLADPTKPPPSWAYSFVTDFLNEIQPGTQENVMFYARLICYFDSVEMLAPLLDKEYTVQKFLPMARRHLNNPRLLRVTESAFAAMLSLYKAYNPCILSETQWFLQILLSHLDMFAKNNGAQEHSPYIQPRQVQVAYAGVIQALADTDVDLAWWAFRRLVQDTESRANGLCSVRAATPTSIADVRKASSLPMDLENTRDVFVSHTSDSSRVTDVFRNEDYMPEEDASEEDEPPNAAVTEAAPRVPQTEPVPIDPQASVEDYVLELNRGPWLLALAYVAPCLPSQLVIPALADVADLVRDELQTPPQHLALVQLVFDSINEGVETAVRVPVASWWINNRDKLSLPRI